MAIACIAGSMIAANENLGVDHGRAYVFHTWWFLGLMGLLLVNLCLCSWEKSYIAITLYKKKNTIASSGFFRKAGHAAAIPWKGSLEPVEGLLRRSYTVVHQKGSAFYAQKGLFGRLGATIIHIGLLWTMSAGYYRILSDELGWGVYDSTVILPEGQTSNIYHTRIDRLKGPTHENFREVTMPFNVRALDFSADYYPHSTVARHFSSLIELRDGDHTEIQEISMTNPLVYKGYKVTQNSFSPNERIVRGKYRVFDKEKGTAVEFDASPGDPVRVKLPGESDLYFQVDSLNPGAPYHFVSLANQKILETGTVQDVSRGGAAPLDVNLAQYQEPLKNTEYAFLVAALFPNFIFDENRQPTTRDEKFENPAVLVMLFKKGQPNGYTWLFQNKDAQQIVGQPHPEMDMHFLQFRKIAGTTGEGGLYDYEVEIELREKATGIERGKFWAKPGQVQDVKGVSDSVLSAPPVTTAAPVNPHGDESGLPAGHHMHDGHDHSAHDHSAHDHAPATDDTLTTRGGAETTASVAGGGQVDSSAATPSSGRYEVTWMGETTGHVTFLGFMKDPSVSWLFAGCCIIIFGTLIAFMLVYREVWVYHDEGEGVLYLATAVRGTSPGAHREFDRKVEELKALSAAQPTSPEPEQEPLVTA